MADVLEILKGHGIGWSLWNLRGAFGVVDSGREDLEFLHASPTETCRLPQGRGHARQPTRFDHETAVVHEAYVRLVDVKKAQHWDSRGHFFAAAAEAMRRILVYARAALQCLLSDRRQ